MASVVVLGAGFGGITAALELRRALPREHRVVLVERRDRFMMGLRKLWILAGHGTRAEGERSLSTLASKGIDLRRAAIQRIDLDARVVRTDAGEIAWDKLVVALGAEPRPDLVPGWSGAAYNLYDAGEVERLAAAVGAFAGGRIVVGVLGVPYKCPPAPYEAAMLVDDLLRRRGVREVTEILAFTPQPRSLPVAGEGACDAVEGHLGRRGILFMAGKKALRLEGARAIFDGGSLDADVLIGVPPHRPPKVVKESGLAGGGEWVIVDRWTLRTPFAGVWGVGDCVDIALANKMSLPKAGVMAEAQARVAAGGVVADLTGASQPAPFDGKGYCFVEVGGGEAARVEGEFLAEPAPRVKVSPPTAEGLEAKREFESVRLARWFG